jgi:hypothetical protein
MSAKRKLNAAHFNGIVFVAGMLGLATGSATVFVLAAAVLLVTGWHAGDLRPPR